MSGALLAPIGTRVSKNQRRWLWEPETAEEVMGVIVDWALKQDAKGEKAWKTLAPNLLKLQYAARKHARTLLGKAHEMRRAISMQGSLHKQSSVRMKGAARTTKIKWQAASRETYLNLEHCLKNPERDVMRMADSELTFKFFRSVFEHAAHEMLKLDKFPSLLNDIEGDLDDDELLSMRTELGIAKPITPRGRPTIETPSNVTEEIRGIAHRVANLSAVEQLKKRGIVMFENTLPENALHQVPNEVQLLERVKRLAPAASPQGAAQRYTCFTEGIENSVVLVGMRRAVETLRSISEELNKKGNLRLALPPRCAMIEKWGASEPRDDEATPMERCLLDSDDDRDRQLTLVLFLDAGAPASPERCHDLGNATVDVEPNCGRILAYNSRRVPHAPLRPSAPRLALVLYVNETDEIDESY